MPKRPGPETLHVEHMALTWALWLCSLPLVGILIIPLFGLKAAAVAAGILFVVDMAVCWGLCSWRIFRG